MSRPVVDESAALRFLECGRIAVVGASPDPRNFGHTVFAELRAHGIDAVPVNPNAQEIDGCRCHPDVASVPVSLDGVMVVVHRERATQVVEECLALGIPRIWLFQGLGGPGAVSDEAVERCREAGVEVVPGACPLMFLGPVSRFHRLHRSARVHLTHSLAPVEPASR